ARCSPCRFRDGEAALHPARANPRAGNRRRLPREPRSTGISAPQEQRSGPGHLMSARDLLFELRTEELPPRTLQTLSSALSQGVAKGIDDAGIPRGEIHTFASPRRLAVWIEKLAERQPDRQVERRGPPVSSFFARQGGPTHAGLTFPN